MRLFIRLAIFFYLFIILIVGFTALLVMAHMIDFGQYLSFLRFIYFDGNASLVAGVIVAAIMLISLIFARIIYGRQEKERLIQVDNPLGRVTISLSAIEDLIRRLVVLTPQVREIKPDVISTKNGLRIDLRLVLRSGVNIPEMTAELQEIIKRKMQELIGNDERVTVRVHVIKIAPDGVKGKGEDEIMSPLPFHGYRA
jgi:hypothetical protein